jgi:hypothetical protein
MNIGIIASWTMLIGGIALGLFALSFIVDILFYCFAWCFCRVDDVLQERHWRKMRSQITSEDIDGLRKIFEEAA